MKSHFLISKIFWLKLKNIFMGEMQKMKKMFIMFLLFLSFLPVWAGYQKSVVTIRTTVSKITLSEAATSEDGSLALYKLYGGLDSPSSSSVDYVLADDISRSDITVYFRIAQEAKTRTDESIKLSVEAESLLNTDYEALLSQDPTLLVKTGEPVISNVSCFGTEALNVSYNKEQNNTVLFSLNYFLGRPVENINLAFFTTTWNKTEGLAPGLYTAKITLSYITN